MRLVLSDALGPLGQTLPVEPGHPDPAQAVLKALCKERNISLAHQIDVLTFSFKYLLFPSVCDLSLSRTAVALPRQCRSTAEPLSASSPRPSAILIPLPGSSSSSWLRSRPWGPARGDKQWYSCDKSSFPAVTAPLSSRTQSSRH